MTQNSFMPVLGMGILAVVAYGLLSKKSPAAGMDSSGYSSSYGGVSSGSAPAGVAEAVKVAPAVAPSSTVVNSGGGSGTPNTGTSYAAWKKNADGTYTDTKGTVSTADDVKHGWQSNNPSAGVAGAVSGVSQEAFDARIAQDRSSNPLYKDVPINLGLPTLTKAPNNGVVGAVSLPDGVKVTSEKPSSASSSPFGVVWNSAMSVVDAITGTPTLAGMITGKGRGSLFI